MTGEIALVPVDVGQAAELSALCHEIYPQHYTYLWDDGGAWYMHATYSVEQLQAELADGNARFFFIEKSGHRAGYLKLKLDSDLAGEDGGLEVERIYLSSAFSGHGLGKYAMDAAGDIARRRNKRYLWLHVMDTSLDSIAFYASKGFSVVGESFLPFEHMLPEYRRMWRMKKPL